MTVFLLRLAAFLSQWCREADGEPLSPDPAVLQDAMQLLIEEDIFTPEDLRQEAATEYSIIIPHTWIKRKDEKDE